MNYLKHLILSFFVIVFSFALNVDAADEIVAGSGEPKITSVELYLINVEVQRHFSFGNWNSRQHVMARFVGENFEGWGEGIFAQNKTDFNLEDAARDFKKVIGLTPTQILNLMRANRKMFNWHHAELINMAMWDIKGKVENKPSIKLLGLDGEAPVNGMFCILENDPQKVVKQAELAKKDKLTNYIKLKIFGKSALDCELVKTLRGSMGDKCFIVADANCGYKKFNGLDNLAATLKPLAEAGLNALEDPSPVSDLQLVELQDKCHSFNLSLIPDVNMRPAWTALANAPRGMGDFYNLHPGCMVDFYDMAQLAKKIKSWNAKIMIGDDSLVGASCTIYQQIAIGCQAAWMEALEKPQESSVFLDCILEQATYRTPEGLYAMKKNCAGWGLKVDVEKLKKTATRWVEVK